MNFTVHKLLFKARKSGQGVQVDLRRCPECGVRYGRIHPDTSCKYGKVQQVLDE